jgi:hypothetical protein
MAVLLVALSLVTWRQARALEVLASLNAVQEARALADADRVELERRIQQLESRAHVVPEAIERLGMHRPLASEIHHLEGGTP